MQKCHSMCKDEIDCYIGFGGIGDLVEVQGKTDHHGYVNILQQHLLASAVDIFIINKHISFSNWTMPLTDRVTGFLAWQLEFPTGAVTWIFPRYEYNRYGNGVHCTQIDERATFECFITLSMCLTGFGEITQGYCEVSTHVCLIGWQNFTVRKPTQQKFWWNVYSYYRTWLLIYKVYCKYILCIENIVKTSWVTFSFNQLWRHRLRHIIVRNLSINTVLTSPSPKQQLQKEGFKFRPIMKIHG